MKAGNWISSVGRWATLLACLPGCALHPRECEICFDEDYYRRVAADVHFDTEGESTGAVDSPPLSLSNSGVPAVRPMGLDEAIRVALENSPVMRDLGATVLRFPESSQTVFSPAAVATDPQLGVEGALSAFDAQLGTRMFFFKNDRALNNPVFGGGTRLILQDLHDYTFDISKRTAGGTSFSLRHNFDYDANNAPANLFPSAWDTNIEGEIRQPLLQGAGVEFNRIAGPDAVPGIYRGVLIARLNTEVALADFQAALRDHLSNVENAYWDLYFAYRDLDARIAARDASLETWRVVKTRQETGRRGGEAEKEAQAREQYFRLEEEVQNSLSGLLLQRTRTYNGSSGGTFRGVGGVQVAERQLRLALGLPINDGRLIRPSDEPIMAKVVFDWDEVAGESVVRREEIRRQQDVVRRAELELVASRNFLLPRVDGVGLYRWRGFGHDLIDTERGDQFDNAYANMTSGDFQEWQLGVELSLPIGYRQGHAAVRNAQLRLARARAVLGEQEREVVYGLSNALAECDRAFLVSQTAYNRMVAAVEQLAAAQAAYEADRVPVDQLLDAQERLADSQSRFYRARVEHALAVKNVHYEKGSLLDYNGVYLAEGPRPCPVDSEPSLYHGGLLAGRFARLDRGPDEPPLVGAAPAEEGLVPVIPQSEPLGSPPVTPTEELAPPAEISEPVPLPPAGL
jgi:outer membrane protein TolC